MSAIETSYRGCRFRSRLEARWACFWDHLETRWEYEPQGFVIGGRPYLPDFRLPNGTWIEVKGSESELDHGLMLAAAAELPGDASPRLLILVSVTTFGTPTSTDLPSTYHLSPTARTASTPTLLPAVPTSTFTCLVSTFRSA